MSKLITRILENLNDTVPGNNTMDTVTNFIKKSKGTTFKVGAKVHGDRPGDEKKDLHITVIHPDGEKVKLADHNGVAQPRYRNISNLKLKESVELSEDVKTSLQNIVDALIKAGDVTHTAHWNLRSSAFVAIHPWLGETYDALFSMADDVAEQIKIVDINNMVVVNRSATIAFTDEQQLFKLVQTELESTLAVIDAAGKDKSIDRTTQNLIDGWRASVAKMAWFVKASIE